MNNPGVQDARSQLQEFKRQMVAQMGAEQRIYQRYMEADREADRWRHRAELAVGRGDGDLARAALARSARHEADAAEFRRQYLEQKGYVEQMKSQLLSLESRPAGVPARATRPLDLARLERNLLELERQQERAAEQRARAAAWAELERDELSEKLDALERTDRLERQLAEMKERLGRG